MFGSNKKNPPKIKTKSYDLVYDQKYDQWKFNYKNIEFIIKGNEIEIPSVDNLNIYLSWVNSHKEHIDKKVKVMADEWKDVFVDASKANIACIEIERPTRISVMVLGDETWGDLAYNLLLEDGKIINETFND